jgi:hypothetical protein
MARAAFMTEQLRGLWRVNQGEAALPTKERAAAELDGAKAARCWACWLAACRARGPRKSSRLRRDDCRSDEKTPGRPSVQDVGPECLQWGTAPDGPSFPACDDACDRSGNKIQPCVVILIDCCRLGHSGRATLRPLRRGRGLRARRRSRA